MNKPVKTCAIYTRKSTDERLDMEFNTLDAQREACEAYVLSQKSEGWKTLPDIYGDGGFSGGSLKRPALQQLISDIKANKVDVVVVYKIDRLTRSLADFSKLVDVFDEYGVTFVSVTQSFNTTTSMGRLTLNVLLSFAQFEREVTGERIRDKIAASKAKGMWQGGRPPFGFDIGDRRLISNHKDAVVVNEIFNLYLQLGCVRKLSFELNRRGIKNRKRVSQQGLEYGGCYFSRGALYSLLQNAAYIGKIVHKGKEYEGLHDAIVPSDVWDKVQQQLKENTNNHKGVSRQNHNNLLTGKIFDAEGQMYSPVYTKKGNKRYRYYFNQSLAHDKNHPNYLRARFPAHEIENVIEASIRDGFSTWFSQTDDVAFNYFMSRQTDISAQQLVSSCLDKVIVKYDQLILHLKPAEISEIAYDNLKISLTCSAQEAVVNVSYKSVRSNVGAVVIKSKQNDLFDLPAKQLKKLVQGVIWRDEHFDGMTIKAIADCTTTDTMIIKEYAGYNGTIRDISGLNP